MTSAERAPTLDALKPYPAYKDSGVEWIGDIPSTWQASRLRSSMLLNPRKSERVLPDEVSFVPMEAVGEDGSIDVTTTRPAEEVLSGYTYFTDGDLLIAKVTPCFENGKGAVAKNLTNGVGFGSTEFHVLRGTDRMIAEFAYYLTLSHGFRKLGEGSMYGAGGQKRVGTAFMRDVVVPTPPRDDQDAIAAFLDHETARIDALVREQELLLGELERRRELLFFNRTTKGYEKVDFDSSGVQWIGDIPTEWKVAQLRSVARLESGHTPSRAKPEYWLDCTIKWVTLGDVHQFRDLRSERIYDTAEQISQLGLASSSARLLPKDTVILSRTASVGFSVILGEPMATTQDFANWICGPLLRPEYLLYVLRGMRHEFGRLMMGSTHKTIYMP